MARSSRPPNAISSVVERAGIDSGIGLSRVALTPILSPVYMGLTFYRSIVIKSKHDLEIHSGSDLSERTIAVLSVFSIPIRTDRANTSRDKRTIMI